MIRLRGGTDQTVYLKLVDSSNDPVSVAFDALGIGLQYWRPGAAAAITSTPITQTVNGAHVDWGWVHVFDGIHRFDLPDAAVAAGVNEITVSAEATGAKKSAALIYLSDADVTVAPATAASIFQALMATSITGVTSPAAKSLLNFMRAGGLPLSRITIAGSTITIFEEDESTVALTMTLGGTTTVTEVNRN